LRLDRRTLDRHFTFYSAAAPPSIPPDEPGPPIPQAPAEAWPPDDDVVGADVDPRLWPAWTDRVAFGVDAEIGGEA
jgi:hypothetical protein